LSKKERYCILTNDVETTSIANHCLSEKAGDLVLSEGMPALLNVYSKYDVKSTFFFNGDIIRQHPEIVRMILKDGHEVASHGWTHEPDKAFDVLSIKEQIEHLTLSKRLLEEISGKKVVSFRAPALRINSGTAEALFNTGFLVDSSVSPQRMDMFFSFGVIKKLKWFFAPRMPYQTSEKKLWKKGNGKIFEIPISALGFAYIGTTLRIMPFITKITRYLLHLETCVTGKPIVFLTHPNEFINEEIAIKKTERRSKNIISYLFGDVIRRKLKLKNLGSKALPLYEREIRFFQKKGYKFVTCENYLILNKQQNAR
jgi:peptidoglycan/xylan/chitin deacetylase (PgdA/CDA1 family)